MTAPSPNCRPKILIADDHRPNLIALRRILAGIDADLVEASNGNDVLAATLDHEFALILLDVQMPDMNGFEAATLLAGEERTRSTPIIFVTASFADDVNRMRGYSFGAVDYITKPVNEVMLLSKVRVFLDLHRSKIELRTALDALAERNRQLEHEVTERRAAEARVSLLALHDNLTGIPNRLQFMNQLQQAIASADSAGGSFALAFLDIDAFKPINDSHGHQTGDELLVVIARRLRGGLRPGETVARLGGDEFAAILHIDDPTSATTRADEIADIIFNPYELHSRRSDGRIAVDIQGSLGVALYPHHGRDVEALIRAADLAMYAAKNQGCRMRMFEPAG